MDQRSLGEHFVGETEEEDRWEVWEDGRALSLSLYVAP